MTVEITEIHDEDETKKNNLVENAPLILWNDYDNFKAKLQNHNARLEFLTLKILKLNLFNALNTTKTLQPKNEKSKIICKKGNKEFQKEELLITKRLLLANMRSHRLIQRLNREKSDLKKSLDKSHQFVIEQRQLLEKIKMENENLRKEEKFFKSALEFFILKLDDLSNKFTMTPSNNSAVCRSTSEIQNAEVNLDQNLIDLHFSLRTLALAHPEDKLDHVNKITRLLKFYREIYHGWALNINVERSGPSTFYSSTDLHNLLNNNNKPYYNLQDNYFFKRHTSKSFLPIGLSEEKRSDSKTQDKNETLKENKMDKTISNLQNSLNKNLAHNSDHSNMLSVYADNAELKQISIEEDEMQTRVIQNVRNLPMWGQLSFIRNMQESVFALARGNKKTKETESKHVEIEKASNSSSDTTLSAYSETENSCSLLVDGDRGSTTNKLISPTLDIGGSILNKKSNKYPPRLEFPKNIPKKKTVSPSKKNYKKSSASFDNVKINSVKSNSNNQLNELKKNINPGFKDNPTSSFDQECQVDNSFINRTNFINRTKKNIIFQEKKCTKRSQSTEDLDIEKIYLRNKYKNSLQTLRNIIKCCKASSNRGSVSSVSPQNRNKKSDAKSFSLQSKKYRVPEIETKHKYRSAYKSENNLYTRMPEMSARYQVVLQKTMPQAVSFKYVTGKKTSPQMLLVSNSKNNHSLKNHRSFFKI